MGPRLGRRGEPYWVMYEADQIVLQWGHVLVDVESGAAALVLRTSILDFNGATSW